MSGGSILTQQNTDNSSSMKRTREEQPGDVGNFVVLVQNQYIARVFADLGGELGGDLEEGKSSRKQHAVYEALIDARSPATLPAVARARISKALRVPWVVSSLEEAVAAAREELCKFCAEKNQGESQTLLRIDCIPQGLGDAVAAALVPKAPHSGTTLTRSASKATLCAAFVRVNRSVFRWGFCSGADAENLSSLLNHNAVCPVIPVKSAKNSEKVDPLLDAPVSRAYWKMAEIINRHVGWWATTECSRHELGTTTRRQGLDLGSSPGGWTQALRGGGGGDNARVVQGGGSYSLGVASCSHVLSIDPGKMSERVLKLGGVQHAAVNFTSDAAARAIAAAAPFSAIVCDANVDPPSLLPMVRDTLRAAAMALPPHPAAEAADDGVSRLLCHPHCLLVLTLKFPYKTVSSVERNLALLQRTLPAHLREIAGLVDENVPYKVVHLYANSPCERTLIADVGGDLIASPNR